MAAADETYSEVKGLIRAVTKRTVGACPADRDAVASAADLGFVRAYHSYDQRTKFTTWVAYKVEKAVRTELGKQARRAARCAPTDPAVIDAATPATPRLAAFDPDDFFADFTADARRVAELVLWPPRAVTRTVKELGQGDSTANFRYAVRKFLTGLGWPAARITAAFVEVKEKL